MLQAIIEGADTSALERMRAIRALRCSWCWPRVRKLAAAARRLGGDRPAPPRIGEALLVAVTADGAPGALALLGDGNRGSELPIQAEARLALRRAERLVTRDLPILTRGDALSRPTNWSASLVWKEDGRAPIASIDGGSYGGAFVLAAASRLLGISVPGSLAVSATLDDRGQLGPVAHLPAKLALVAGSALGVNRLVVATEQVLEARRAADRLSYPARLKVVGASDVASLIDRAFGDLSRHPPPWAGDSSRAARVASELFRVALEGSPILSWRHVARTARMAARSLPSGSRERRLVAFAERVARRHENQFAPIPWPSDEDMAFLSRPVEQAYLAHVVQAATDAGIPDLAETLERARRRLPQDVSEHHPADLRLRGAIGRALARLRRYEEARDVLRGTVDGWFGTYEAGQASYALCELLRVEGIRGDRKGVSWARERALAAASDPRMDFIGRAFLWTHIGRALVQVGAPRAALPWLSGEAFDLVRGDAENAALRWRARALIALGRAGEARALRRLLHERAPNSDQDLLCALDAAIARGESGKAEARRVQRAVPHLLRLVLTDAPLRSGPRLIADECPY